MTITRKTLTGTALAVLTVLFVALVSLSNLLFRGARLDLTEHSLYTLSEGTRNILGKLDEPIHLSLYFSNKASADSNRPEIRNLRNYYERVREMLEEMASLAGNKIRLDVIDPLPYSEAEDRAAAAGIQGIPLGAGGEKIFLGLAGTNSTDGESAIPFFDPGKEAFLEYDAAKLIVDLTTVKKPVVGLLSGLPVASDFNQATMQMSPPWAIYQQLTQLFEVKQLDIGSLKAIEPDIKVLAVIHPKQLSDDAQYAIDQFALRGGHLLIFVDPNAELDTGGFDHGNPMAGMMASKSSDLPVLFKNWGIEYDANQIVVNPAQALTITVDPGAPPVRHAAFLRFDERHHPADDVITAHLGTLHMASTGYFKLAKNSPGKLIPILQTDQQASTVPSERIKMLNDPGSLLSGLNPAGERYVVAARLEGKFKTAFPKRTDSGHLSEAKAASQMILVADTDILTDRLWVQAQSFFGQTLLNSFADNGNFFINTVDNLIGSSDLISIRGRGTSDRPFTRVEALKLAADQRFRVKEQELQQELMETERKLSALQNSKAKDDKFMLSTQQQAELENFLKRKLEIRKELRDVRRQLDADIDSLGAWLKFINIALVPLLLTLGALWYLGWKAKQEKM